MEKPTALELAMGNPVAQAAVTSFATAIGTPLASVLPVLAGTLAAGRFQARVEKAILEIEQVLIAHRTKLNEITDPQYKLMNEIVLAVLQNTEEEKIKYLRNAMIAGLECREISHTIAAQVSRALRDMTAGELAFVVKYSGRNIMIGPVTHIDPDDSALALIDRSSEEMIYVSGLISLGVLSPAGSSMAHIGRYEFAKFSFTLKTLIEERT